MGRDGDGAHLSLLERLALVDRERRVALVEAMGADAEALLTSWAAQARPAQLPPPGDWRTWLILAGRGFGKTRAGAEWIKASAAADGDLRIALVGATAAEARAVMVEGESGLLAVSRPHERPHWQSSLGLLVWPSGARALVYSAEAPDRLRGPQHHLAWCDEIAKWPQGEAAWDNLLLGLRLGERPRVLATTTPRPVALVRRLLDEAGTVVTRGRTADNVHLARAFVHQVTQLYGGTRLGRQELDGELIDEVDGALWTRAMIETCRVRKAPAIRRVVVGVDPPAGVGRDACGIVVVAMGEDGRGHVVEDASVGGLGPEGWARAVADAAERHKADRVIAEANNGGAMVESVLRAVDATLPVRRVHATHGKVARAEPIAAPYAAGRVAHVGAFPALEDQMCGLLTGGAYVGPGRSPDRADALVWALWELMLRGRRGPPAVRVV
jgi:phage terminase large subunit-like protein